MNNILLSFLILLISVVVHELGHLVVLKAYKIPYTFKFLDFKRDALFEFIFEEPKSRKARKATFFYGFYAQELFLLFILFISVIIKDYSLAVILTFVLITLKLMVPISHDYKELLK